MTSRNAKVDSWEFPLIVDVYQDRPLLNGGRWEWPLEPHMSLELDEGSFEHTKYERARVALDIKGGKPVAAIVVRDADEREVGYQVFAWTECVRGDRSDRLERGMSKNSAHYMKNEGTLAHPKGLVWDVE